MKKVPTIASVTDHETQGKRIYTDQTVHGTADDTPNSYCVATQKEFATKLLGDDYDFCDYEE